MNSVLSPILFSLISNILLFTDGSTTVASVLNTQNSHCLPSSSSASLSDCLFGIYPETQPMLASASGTPDWYPLGPGLNNVVYDIKLSGTDVYAGGGFTDAGGNPDADFLARWDGCEWHAVGPGLNGAVRVIALNGGNVYVGGDFTAPFNHIGFWDGVQWNAMGSGLNGTVVALAISGSDIYVGGRFTDAGGNGNGDHVAHWNGSSWVNLGSGLNDEVLDIEINGNDVYVGGRFTDAGNNPDADFIARWDSTNWNNLGTTLEGAFVNQIELDGNKVYISGPSPWPYIMPPYWDGSEWHALDFNNALFAETMLIYGGNIFLAFGTSDCTWLIRYDLNGQYWEPLPNGCFYANVFALASNGIDLYAGGDFVYGGNNFNCPECMIMRYGEPDAILIIEGVPAEICQTDPPFTLATTQSGFIGNWSGLGVVNNVFDPSGLDGEITITFTPDPGQCVSPVDTFLTVIDCSPSPCPSAGEDITVSGCPNNQYFENFLIYLNADPGGTWDPPYFGYGPCIDEEGSYTYTQDNPGCPIEQATITFDWTWDPCDWKLESLCLTGDEGSFTIPAFEGVHPGSTYTVHSNCITIMPMTGSLDESTDFTFSWNIWIQAPGCINIWISINEDPSCEYYFGEPDGFSGDWLLCNLPLCNCVDPPYAGEDNVIAICPFGDHFDLTTALEGVPDQNGAWTPSLHSGGNLYHPMYDGPGQFAYTTSTPGCPDDDATVTISFLDNLQWYSTWIYECKQEGNPNEWTDDLITLTIPPYPGNPPGVVYGLGLDEFFSIIDISGNIGISLMEITLMYHGHDSITTYIYLADYLGNLCNVEITSFVNSMEFANLCRTLPCSIASGLKVDAGDDQFIAFGDDAMLMADATFDVAKWSWSPADFLSCVDCPDPTVIRPNRDMTFIVEVTDENGCTASDFVTVFVHPKIFIPTAFSPNGDGINDVVMVYAISGVRNIRSLRFYSRWGEVVSENYHVPPNDPDFGWDGRHNGQKLNPGVYVWIAEVEFVDGNVKTFSGGVTLIK